MDRIANLFGQIGTTCVILMMLHILVDVASKQFFLTPIPLTIEIVAGYYMVAIVFLPLAVVEQRDAHIVVDVFADRLPEGIRRSLLLFSGIFSTAFFGLLGYRTWFVALEKFDTGSYVMGTQGTLIIWPAYFLLPLGSGLMALVSAVKVVRQSRREERAGTVTPSEP